MRTVALTTIVICFSLQIGRSQDRNRANVRIDLHGVQPSGVGTIPADWQRQYEILTKVKPTLRMPAGKNSTESEAFQFTTQEARDTQGSEMSLQFDKSFKECRWREQVLPICQELARELELMPSVPYRVNICTADRYIAVSIHDDNESPYRLFLCERNGNQLWKTVVVPFECSPWPFGFFGISIHRSNIQISDTSVIIYGMVNDAIYMASFRKLDGHPKRNLSLQPQRPKAK